MPTIQYVHLCAGPEMTPRENGARGPSNTKIYGSGGDSLFYHTITYQKSHDMKGFAQKGGFYQRDSGKNAHFWQNMLDTGP